MPNTCPQCQRPVRAGARFCGFCSTSLVPVQSVPAHLAPSVTAPVASTGGYCPHCNAPLRPGVRFCANCGKSISQAPEAVPVPPSLTQVQPVPAPPPAELPPSIGAARDRRRKRSRGRFVIYLIPLFLLCGVIAILAVIIGRPLYRNWPILQNLPVIQNWIATPTTIITETEIVIPTSTTSPTSTLTPPATATSTLGPTQTATSTATNTEVLPPTLTSTISPPLISDTFEYGATAFWALWGVTGTFTTTGGLDPAGLLIYPDLNTGGIASLEYEIPFAPGLVISFTVDMDLSDIDPGPGVTEIIDPELIVAWSPNAPQEFPDTMPMVFWIIQDLVSITLRPEGEDPRICEPITLTETENFYRITIDRSNTPHFYVNDQEECLSISDPMPPFPLLGQLFFSGQAIIDDVYVTIEP